MSPEEQRAHVDAILAGRDPAPHCTNLRARIRAQIGTRRNSWFTDDVDAIEALIAAEGGPR
jgi:hypothetical protein